MSDIEKHLHLLEQLPEINTMNVYIEYCVCRGDKNEVLKRLDLQWSTVQYHLKKLVNMCGGELFASRGKNFALTNLGLDTQWTML